MSEPDPPFQPLVVILCALTVVSGIFDAVSFLALGHVFTANMTGNIALIGFAIAGAPGFSVIANVCALGLFLVGAVAGGRIGRRVQPTRSLLLTVVSLEAALVAAAAAIAGAVAVLDSGWPRYTDIALLSFAMGVRNAVVRRVGVADMTTTVMTTTLARMVSDSWLAGGNNANVVNRGASVLCLFAGALVGAVLVVHVHPGWALTIAAVLLVTTAAYSSRTVPSDLGVA